MPTKITQYFGCIVIMTTPWSPVSQCRYWKSKVHAPLSCHPRSSKKPWHPLPPQQMTGRGPSEKDFCSEVKVKGMFFSLAILADLYLYTRRRSSKTYYLKMWPSFGDHKAVKLKTRPKHSADVGEEGKEEQGPPQHCHQPIWKHLPLNILPSSQYVSFLNRWIVSPSLVFCIWL